ncbi:uncharacterized protein LOC114165462 [Vigna unguiculata]|uniref:uncharacterized protein LOC114165462 n=1 Tax=Vigna unguiculata TaxID=3917 RepID=UPI0010168815|nr:uncharacterized protein LOC114165462 [Vigna unguiculata]
MEATQSGSLILDFCLLLGNQVLVLFDSGASHSFISHDCVKKLGLSTYDLGCELIVSKPASGQVSTNSTCVGCSMEVEGRVVVPESEGIKLISTHRALKEIEEGATCFMIVAHGEKKNLEEYIRSIPVVDDYADVFPDEIPELPPSRDIDFSIDLIPRAGPVSAAPYRM